MTAVVLPAVPRVLIAEADPWLLQLVRLTEHEAYSGAGHSSSRTCAKHVRDIPRWC